MARRNATISASVADDLSSLTITVQGFDPITIEPAKLSPEVRSRALIHGLGQKIGDAAALGRDATDEAKYQAMRSVADRLIEGEWNKRSGEGGGQPTGIIFRAFMEWTRNKAKKAKKPEPTEDAIRAVYDKLERKGQLALRTVPEIAEIMDRIKSESMTRNSNSVDTDALLGELGI